MLYTIYIFFRYRSAFDTQPSARGGVREEEWRRRRERLRAGKLYPTHTGVGLIRTNKPICEIVLYMWSIHQIVYIRAQVRCRLSSAPVLTAVYMNETTFGSLMSGDRSQLSLYVVDTFSRAPSHLSWDQKYSLRCRARVRSLIKKGNSLCVRRFAQW